LSEPVPRRKYDRILRAGLMVCDIKWDMAGYRIGQRDGLPLRFRYMMPEMTASEATRDWAMP